MFEEAQLYSEVTRSATGEATVHLDQGHPGASDADYRARRNALATLAMEWEPGQPISGRAVHRGGAPGLAHGLHRAAPAA